MTNIIGNLEDFKKYIHDSSAAIFSEKSNRDHDWGRKIRCSLSVDGVPFNLLIKNEGASGETEDFVFIFDLEFVALHTEIDKNKAKELICWIADEMRFHPNIRILDRTEHSDEGGFHYTGVEPQGSDRYFWLKPKNFKHNTELERYCWEGIPESSDCWTSIMVVSVKLTPLISNEYECWGRSFDIEFQDPLSLLRLAIRQRDGQKAKEEAERQAAADKAERELTEACEKLEIFLRSIGDFDMNGVPISERWKFQTRPDGPVCLILFFGEDYLYLDVLDDFNRNVNKIINWAVANGATEPLLEGSEIQA